jgi:CelD/BcsL family acetyltransferase involved in cellulose biosynthesis
MTTFLASRIPLTEALTLGPDGWRVAGLNGGRPSPFMSWEWHHAWAEVARPEATEPSEVVRLVAPGGELHALFPVAVREQRMGMGLVAVLTWPTGDTGAPDHLDIPASQAAELEPLAGALDELRWDVVLLPNVADDAANVRRLCTAFAARGYHVRSRPLWACPYLDLPTAWEEYLDTLPATRRQTFRRKERKLAREHDLKLTDYGRERFDEGWEQLMRLHRMRWDQGGSAFTEGLCPLVHRRFARELAREGKLWLVSLDLDGTPAAAWYGFAHERTVYFFQSGRDPAWERTSAGVVLMNMMIRRAIERGFARFDFMRGEESYKRRWTATQRTCYEWAVFRPGARGAWLRAAYAVRRARALWRERRERAGIADSDANETA